MTTLHMSSLTRIHAKVTPLSARPPGSHEVTVAEVGEDMEQEFRRQSGDGHFV